MREVLTKHELEVRLQQQAQLFMVSDGVDDPMQPIAVTPVSRGRGDRELCNWAVDVIPEGDAGMAIMRAVWRLRERYDIG
jgi:hypothetical protein